MTVPRQQLNIVIASSLGAGSCRADPRGRSRPLRVTFDPELLPVPRYVADHHGAMRDLRRDAAATLAVPLGRCRYPLRLRLDGAVGTAPQCAASALDPGDQRRHRRDGSPRWAIQLGHHLHDRCWRPCEFPAEFALLGMLYFYRGVPELLRWQATHHWERYTNRELTGARVLIVGLGGVGGGRGPLRQFRPGGLGQPAHCWSPTRRRRASTSLSRDPLRVPAIDGLRLACPLTDQTAV